MTAKDKVNILMVDDQPAKLLTYEVMLSELDENLIKASSGREALEHLLKTEVAVVLMDVSMPDLDGFELAALIRQHPRFQRTAIIFISAVHLTDLDRLKGYEHGAVDYISVPVVPEVLRAKVNIFAELHRKTRQLETLNQDLEQRVAERTEELEAKTQALAEAQPRTRSRKTWSSMRSYIPLPISSSIGSRTEPEITSAIDFMNIPTLRRAQPLAWAGGITCTLTTRSEASSVGWSVSNREQNYEVEYRLRGKNGDYRWFRARAVPIRDHVGENHQMVRDLFRYS